MECSDIFKTKLTCFQTTKCHHLSVHARSFDNCNVCFATRRNWVESWNILIAKVKEPLLSRMLPVVALRMSYVGYNKYSISLVAEMHGIVLVLPTLTKIR